MDNVTITTRYSGPTDTRGSRIVATGHGRQLTVPYDYALNATGNHEAAALALAKVLGYNGDLRYTAAPRLTRGYRFTGCVVVRGLTVTDDGVFAPTEVVPKRPPAVFDRVIADKQRDA